MTSWSMYGTIDDVSVEVAHQAFERDWDMYLAKLGTCAQWESMAYLLRVHGIRSENWLEFCHAVIWGGMWSKWRAVDGFTWRGVYVPGSEVQIVSEGEDE